MAKPNLTSIFTSTNQYSVLKLLKALCDAVDNIDYADNTEFTNFKEQVNTAVASLGSTDNSLEQSISDLNTVTGNNSTEINSIKNQISGINTEANGNVSALKNFEVGGNIFTLNEKQWGIMPVFIDSNNVITSKGFIIYSSKPTIKRPQGAPEGVLSLTLDGILVGKELDDIGIISSTYTTSYGVPAEITEDGLYFKDEDYYSRVISTAKSVESIATKDDMSTLQSKLYRHIITLYANSTSDGTCRLECISSNNLQCSSLQDLRTILNNPQMNSYVATNPNADLFGVVISPYTAQFKKVGTTQLLNITSVSDTVTPL